MDKRYQVFVSSTYEDLKEERSEVMKALLELNCIPAGMELFPAADEDSWNLIQREIDCCDYYVLIVGGRYGSTDKTGMSYTEKEFRYAVEIDKPRIAFIPADMGDIPSRKCERTDKGKRALEKFLAYVKDQRNFKSWSNADNLGAVLSRSITSLIKTRPAVGWIRANERSKEYLEEILAFRTRIDELEAEITRLRAEEHNKNDFEVLKQNTICIFSVFPGGILNTTSTPHIPSINFKTTWREIFLAIAPSVVSESVRTNIEKALGLFCLNANKDFISQKFPGMLKKNPPKIRFAGETLEEIRSFFELAEFIRTRMIVSPNNSSYHTWQLTDKGKAVLRTLLYEDSSQPNSDSVDSSEELP